MAKLFLYYYIFSELTTISLNQKFFYKQLNYYNYGNKWRSDVSFPLKIYLSSHMRRIFLTLYKIQVHFVWNSEVTVVKILDTLNKTTWLHTNTWLSAPADQIRFQFCPGEEELFWFLTVSNFWMMRYATLTFSIALFIWKCSN